MAGTAEFEGLHIAVTGGTGALGVAVVAALAGHGAVCHVPSRAAEPPALPGLAGHPGVRLAGGVDPADARAVSAFYAALPPLWGSVHLAGGFAMGGLAETSPAQFEAQWRTNLLGCFLSCQAAVQAFRRRPADAPPGRSGGRIVNVASRPALEPRLGAGMAAYTASKAGVAALTQALGEELAGEAILVNAVAPATLDTPANRQAMPNADRRRWVRPTAVAEAILHLVSPANRAVRSAVVPVFGGG